MFSELTVTVIHDGDPDPPPRLDLACGNEQTGLDAEASIAVDQIYFLRLAEGFDGSQVSNFVNRFLAGTPAARGEILDGFQLPERTADEASVVVLRRPGVMDPVEGSVLHGLGDAGFDVDCCSVKTALRYRIAATSVTRDGLELLAASRLGNGVVDEWHCFLPGEEERIPDPFRSFAEGEGGRIEIPLLEADDEDLKSISENGGLSLSLEEMQTIAEHYRGIGREPTEVELETIAQTWSEHCCHKTLTGPINYGEERIENLLKETIFGVTKKIDAPWCWSVFKDNAGVIGIDEEWGVSFKVETHNHPSALEPYGGAGTGIGGVIRDTLGTGLGARPVLNTDIFCFAPIDTPAEALPPGILPPARLLEGVVSGVRDYGNRMGIPTANGAIHFHPGYLGNPLVFCGSVGLIERRHVDKVVCPGDLIVAIGGRTGRDGIHGATFSSRELTEDSETVSSGAVQIGNPIEEKKVLDAMLRARDEGLYRAVTDCGAGGFSSAVGEMGEETGAEVHLDRAPLKYPGLGATEIWISEAQERMVLAVPPEKIDRLGELLAEEEVEMAQLGVFRDDGILRLRYRSEVVGEISTDFLHNGRPEGARLASKPPLLEEVGTDSEGRDLGETLLQLLGHPSVASKEPVIRQYDHEVQGRMVLRPLAGADLDAPMDGCAFDPTRQGEHTIVVGCGLALTVGEVDPYQMGAQSVDEALRNVVASGGTLERMALLDNFAWGNVHDPEILGAIVECARGAADAALACGAPFISGKDSLHNTYRSAGVSRSIPHTLLVSALSVVPGPVRAPGSDLKKSDSALILVGPGDASIPGSLIQLIEGGSGGAPCRYDPVLAPVVLDAVAAWIEGGHLRSCHDLSEGGLLVAASEMAFGGGGLGVDLDVKNLGLDHRAVLFGEGPHRFLVEVSREEVETMLADARERDIPALVVGNTTEDGRLKVSCGEEVLIELPVAELKACWQAPLEAVWPAVIS